MRLIEDQTCRGGYALRMGDNSGNDEIWLNWFSTYQLMIIRCTGLNTATEGCQVLV